MTSANADLAEALKILRAAGGQSLDMLAGRSNTSKSMIGHVESGYRWPSRAIVRALDQALDAHGLLTSLYDEEDPMRRRALLATVSLVAAGGTEHMRLLEGVSTSAIPQRVGHSDAEAVGQAVSFCTSLDLRMGGNAALGPGRAMLTWAVQLLTASMTDALRSRMYAQVAALADRVAWSHYDAGRDRDAQRLYGAALGLARNGSDPNLMAHILIDESTRRSHNGEHADAASLLRLALDRHAPLLPSVEANVRATLARHLANMDLPKDAVSEIDRSRQAASHIEPDRFPEWSRAFLAAPAHLRSVVSRAQLFAGRYDDAVEGFSAALDGLAGNRGRGRAYALSMLALACLRRGDHDRARQSARDALGAAQGLTSMRVSGHLRVLAHELAATGDADLARHVYAASAATRPS